eukprot:Gb_36682 [translate_table: standard]
MPDRSSSSGRSRMEARRRSRERSSRRSRERSSRKSRDLTPGSERRRRRNARVYNVLRRTVSEPILSRPTTTWLSDDEVAVVAEAAKKKKEKELIRPQTLSDIFDRSPITSSPWLPPRTPSSSSFHKSEKSFLDEDRILVSITVEGSTGPIKAIVKKGATVNDVIKLTIDKYAREGRYPVLDSNTDMFELHVSNFSMESLNRTDRVGELSTRTFFLRQENYAGTEQPVLFPPTPGPLFTSFIARRMKKISRKTRKIWKIIDCMVCG